MTDDGASRAVVEHSLDGILFTVPDGRILSANPAACAIFGVTEEELLQRGRQGFMDPADPRWAALLEERQATGSIHAVATMIRGDGSRFEAEMASTIFSDSEGRTRGCVIVRDVTERVRTECRLRAANEITHALLAGLDTAEVLTLIAGHARLLVGATDAAVVTAGDPLGSIGVVAVDGDAMSGLIGRRFPPGSVMAEVMSSRRTATFDDLSAVARHEEGRRLGIGSAMVVPIVSGERVFGNLVVGTTDRAQPPYGADEVAGVETFAESAGLALAVGEARVDAERVGIIAEQTRIATDMHDRVVQRLFSIGLGLQSTAALTEAPVANRLTEAVEGIDAVIEEIRGTIFALRSRAPRPASVADEICAVVTEAEKSLGFPVTLTMIGTDRVTDPELLQELCSVAREALSDIARHGRARRVALTLTADEEVRLSVADEGLGPRTAETPAVAGIRERATRLGGSVTVENAGPTRTRLEWRVPLPGRA